MASFRQLCSGRWQARVQRRGHKPVTQSFISRQDAEKWARKVERELDQGLYLDRRPLEQTTLAALVERYGNEVTPLKRGKGEPFMLRVLARSDLGGLALATLTPAAVAKYRDQRLKEVAPGTVIRELGLLGAVLTHARREWSIPIPDVVGAIRKPSAPLGRDRVLSTEEEGRLLDALGKESNAWASPIVRMALATGARRGELLTLRWEHVDMVKRVAHFPMTKSGMPRTIPLSPGALEVLKALPVRGIKGVVFPINVNTLGKVFDRARKAAGLADVHFHDLRHTAISRMAEKLPNVVELAAVSGHADVRMLKRYYHVAPEVLARKLG